MVIGQLRVLKLKKERTIRSELDLNVTLKLIRQRVQPLQTSCGYPRLAPSHIGFGYPILPAVGKLLYLSSPVWKASGFKMLVCKYALVPLD